MHFRRFLSASLCALGLLMLLPGCDQNSDVLTTLETDDSDYRRGKEFLLQGRNKEALAAFLRVIERRGNGAPESHLDVGILYQEHIKDPIAAIYHYRKYNELKPNSRQEDLVRQRIEAAMREFAKTLPLQPNGGQYQRADLLGAIEQLRQQNAMLNSQLTAAQNALQQVQAQTPVQQAPNLLVAVNTPPTAQPQRTTPGTTRTNPPPQTASATPARTHIVAKGDTLSLIAQRYYGSRSRWREIYNANRNVMPNEHSLQVGMELRIP